MGGRALYCKDVRKQTPRPWRLAHALGGASSDSRGSVRILCWNLLGIYVSLYKDSRAMERGSHMKHRFFIAFKSLTTDPCPQFARNMNSSLDDQQAFRLRTLGEILKATLPVCRGFRGAQVYRAPGLCKVPYRDPSQELWTSGPSMRRPLT